MGYPIRWDEIAVPAEHEGMVGGQTEQTASLRAYFHRLTAATVAGAILVCLIVVAVSGLLLRDQHGPALRLDSVTGSDILAVGTPKVVRKLGFVTVTGTVVNRSSATKADVEAVVDLMDHKRNVLSTHSALVERDKMGPGEESSFRIEMADVPDASAYALRFRPLH